MTSALNLNGIHVLKRVEEDHQTTFLVEVVNPKPDRQCCLFVSPVKNGTKSEHFRDLPMHTKFVDVLVRRQRFKCTRCNVVSYARVPLLDTSHRMTKRLAEYLFEASFKRTFAELGREVGISENTVKNVFHAKVQGRLSARQLETPRVLGIDEKHLMGGYRCVLGNVEEKTMLDMLSNRYKRDLRTYLAEMPDKHRVEVVCMDMWPTYRDVVREHFPRAVIVADKFHVVRMANDAMQVIRREIRKTLPEARRIKLKNERYTLLKRKVSWTDRDEERFERWKNEFPELVEVYEVKEEFFDIFDSSSDRQEAERRYIAWQASVPDAYRKLFRPVTTAMTNWGGAAMAHFDHRYTSAYIEGLNRLIGDLNRAGRGYSFDVLRAKAMMAWGQKTPERKFQRLSEGEIWGRERFMIAPAPDYGVPISTLAEAIEAGLFND